MSEPISSENPVVLFGNIGPDVVVHSQIYDPDYDEYMLSRDELAVTGKTYYIRSYSDKTVSFTRVTGVIPTDTPEKNGWYEPNIDGAKSTGKYVPAEMSLVVVDKATEEYDERTILIVESVDEITLKSKLVPHNCGADGSTTARALKYGNGDYQLYFQEEGTTPETRRIVLTPDRKLLLYGSRYYMYRLLRNGKIISAAKPESVETTQNALVPYICPSAKRVTLTGTDSESETYYGKYANQTFDVLSGTRFVRTVVPVAPATEGDAHALVPTFDAVYRETPVDFGGTWYWFFEDAHYELTRDTIYSGDKEYFSRSGTGTSTDPFVYTKKIVTAGTTIPEAERSNTYEFKEAATHAVTECKYGITADTEFVADRVYYRRDSLGRYIEEPNPGASTRNPHAEGLYNQSAPATPSLDVQYYFTAGTVVGYLIKVVKQADGTYVSEGYQYYEPDTSKQAANYAFGSGVTGYVNRTDDNHVYYPDSCYLKAGFSIVSGETIDMEVYEVNENSYTSRLVMNITLSTREGMLLDGTDSSSKHITSLEPILKDNPITTEGVWGIGIDETLDDFKKRITVKLHYDDGSVKTLPTLDYPGLYIHGLEKLDAYVFDVKDPTAPRNVGYERPVLFKYFPNYSNSDKGYINSNSSKNFISTTVRVKAVDNATVTIRKISLLPVWDHRPGSTIREKDSAGHNVYTFRYLVYRTDMKSPLMLNDLGTLLTDDGRLTTDGSGKACAIKQAMYLDDNNIVRPTESSNDLLGYIQHANLSLFAQADGYQSSRYSQRIALQLQNWEYASIPAKWLLGDNTDYWEASLMPYGNPNAGIRPYIEFDGSIAAQEPVTDASGKTTYPAPYRIGMKFNTSKSSFLQSFYYNANPPAVSNVVADAGTVIEPTHFECRSFMTKDIYTCLMNDDETQDVALEPLKDCYYNATTEIKVNVEVGVTPVTPYKIKVPEGIEFFKRVDGAWEPAELAVDTWLTTDDTSAYYKKNFYIKGKQEIKSGIVFIGDNALGGGWCSMFSLPGDYMSKEELDAFGGSVPFVFGNETATTNRYNTQCMGTAAIEFIRLQEGVYKYLYGVPVEVRHPYELTKDPVFKSSKSYYVYGFSNATSGGQKVYNWNVDFPTAQTEPDNVFYKLINYTVDSPLASDPDHPLAIWEAY